MKCNNLKRKSLMGKVWLLGIGFSSNRNNIQKTSTKSLDELEIMNGQGGGFFAGVTIGQVFSGGKTNSCQVIEICSRKLVDEN